MSTSRVEYLIDRDKEYQLIENLCKQLHESFPLLNASNTLLLMVSPDYSATVAMHVAHDLSREGEMVDILPIHVPYPDQFKGPFILMARDAILRHMEANDSAYEYFLLVEAAVIRGSNYRWLTELIRELFHPKIVTASLLENTGSVYKSDVVAEYYDNELQDVTFYYERFNRHWQ
jgi:hypothetical protein